MVARQERGHLDPSRVLGGHQRAAAGAAAAGCVAAWVRTCTSSPIATACAASDSTSTGAARARPPRRGPARAASRRNTSRSTAPGVSLPNHAHVAGALPERRVRATPGPSASSTTHTGVARSHRGGHRHDDVRTRSPATACTSPAAEQRARASATPGRPSPRRTTRGPHRPAQRVAGVGRARARARQCSSSRGRRQRRHHLRGRPHSRRASARRVSSRRSTSALAGVDPLGERPEQPAQRGDRASDRRRPGSASPRAPTGASLARTASANSGSPTLTTSTCVGSWTVMGRPRSRWPRPSPRSRPRRRAARLGESSKPVRTVRALPRELLRGAPRSRTAMPPTTGGAAPPAAVRVSTMCRGSSTSRQVPVRRARAGGRSYCDRRRVEPRPVEVDARAARAAGRPHRDARPPGTPCGSRRRRSASRTRPGRSPG